MKIICVQASAISFLIVNNSAPQKVIKLKCYVIHDIAVARLAEQTRQVLQILKTKLVGASLRASFLGWGRKRKESYLPTTSLEFEFHLQFPCSSPSTELSDFRQSGWIGNECECKQCKQWKTQAESNDIITNVISANQHFASTFLMQIFKFQRHSCKLSSFLSHPRELACRLVGAGA